MLLDASAVVDLLVRSDAGARIRDFLAQHADAALLTVAHLDAEVVSALARLHRADVLDEQEVEALLDRLGQLPVQRLPIAAELLAAGWAMRDNVSARDALYVAAAQAAGALLVTTDGRLARSDSEPARFAVDVTGGRPSIVVGQPKPVHDVTEITPQRPASGDTA